MPYSGATGILFIHIPKTAGKSVEYALGCVDERELESYRWRSPLNRVLTWAQRQTADSHVRTRLWGVLDESLMAQHLTYAEIYLLGLLPARELAECSKVAVCRNPYDRTLSLFRHIRPAAPTTMHAFETFLDEWLSTEPQSHAARGLRRPQWEFCVDLSGKFAVEHIFRYENLAQDFAHFMRTELNVTDSRVTLPWLGRQRADRSYREMYSTRALRLVRDAYRGDFERFRYAV